MQQSLNLSMRIIYSTSTHCMMTVCLSVLAILGCCFQGAIGSSCFRSVTQSAEYYTDCKEAFDLGEKCSGVYTIKPDKLPPFEVYCDMETDGGGWVVFQRRMDGTQRFDLFKSNYVEGFGDLNREFWLSLNNIHRLTTQNGTSTTLRVDLDDFEGNTRFAKYSNFFVLDSSTNYQLVVTGYSGDAGDSLTINNGREFDAENVFATTLRWWGDRSNQDSQLANLNGPYLSGQCVASQSCGVYWSTWRGFFYSLKFTEMKLRRESTSSGLQQSSSDGRNSGSYMSPAIITIFFISIILTYFHA